MAILLGLAQSMWELRRNPSLHPVRLTPPRLPKKRKDESSESPYESSIFPEDPEIDLANGLAKLGYMPTHQVFDIGRAAGNVSLTNTHESV